MSILITTKGSKKYVTSSYFKDMKILKKSEFETDYREVKRNTTISVEKLKLAYLISRIKLWRQGCQELNEWVSKLGKGQLEGIETIYEGKDLEDYEDGPMFYPSESKQIADPENETV